MIKFNSNRDTAIFYTCGICNLNCHYCQIDKNPVLLDIDKALEESFKGDYYFNRVKEYFPRKDQLRRIETWGGEPFLHMDRIYPLIHKLISYYPFFDELFSSTNFSFDGWIDQFFGLMDCLAQYPERKFKYTLQLSVDGPEYINDASRGQGVTKKCLHNFHKLVDLLDEHRLENNNELQITTKGKLDSLSIQKLLTKDALIEYYQFIENNYIEPIQQLNLRNIVIRPYVPNTAVPAPVTKQDGKDFAQLCRLCREIEHENEIQRYFKYYQYITPFDEPAANNGITYSSSECSHCGTGANMLGFLPNNMMSTCHEGFVQFVGKYKELAAQKDTTNNVITFDNFIMEQKVPMCTSDEGYCEHERKMGFYTQNSSARLVSTTAMIIALAMADQIDSIYLDEANALKAALFVSRSTAWCIKDNYNTTGSFAMQPVGLYKLLLNGALQEIQRKEGGFILDTF